MVVTYDHTDIRYSERDPACICDVVEIGAGTAPKTAVIRFEGGGMVRSDKRVIEQPGQFEFFTNGLLTGWYDTDIPNIVVFSCNYPLHRAQNGGADDVEALRPSEGYTQRYTTNTSYMDTWVLAALDAIQFVKENAAVYNVDPDKIVLSGSSAGGFMAACAGYMTPLGYSTRADAFFTKVGLRSVSTQVAALILHNTPLDLTAGTIPTTPGIYAPFVTSAPGTTALGTQLTERARRVSALQIMKDNENHPHVFSWYDETYNPATAPTTAHNPYWGVLHHNELQSRWGGPSDGSDPGDGSAPAHQLYVANESAAGQIAALTGGAGWAHVTGGGPSNWPVTEVTTWLTSLGLV